MIQRTSSKITLGLIVGFLLLSWYLQPSEPIQSQVHVSIAPETLLTVGGFPISNALAWSVFLSISLIIFAIVLRLRLREIPGRLQNIVEALIESYYDFLQTITGNHKKTRKIFPLAFSMFILVLCANLLTLFPGASAITYGKEPLFRAIVTDYNFVLFLTLITVLLIQIVAIITNGPFGYLKKFINISSPLNFFIGILELIGELSRVISMSFRLFGNIFAGEVLGAVMLSLMPYFVPLPFMFLGLLSGVIQAFVFSMLTVIFVSMASEIPSHEG